MDNVVNVWKWSEGYYRIPLQLYDKDDVNLNLVLDVAILVSTWPVINALLKEKCLTKVTSKDLIFYQKNIARLKLPKCPSIKNYQLYLHERKVICNNLIEMMSRYVIK